MSEIVTDEQAGMNGSFEYSKSGLPVNWGLYTPKTVPEGDFDIIIDTTEFMDGKQSLKFEVRGCVPDGGWYSPGIYQEFNVDPGKTYLVSYWLKNEGCNYQVILTGIEDYVKTNEGRFQSTQSTNTLGSWQKFESRCTPGKNQNRLRFELGIVGPGTLRIDDIRIDQE
ncbi:MAG: carbohydrate binding domain-containing protein [Lentimicrobium sp.]